MKLSIIQKVNALAKLEHLLYSEKYTVFETKNSLNSSCVYVVMLVDVNTNDTITYKFHVSRIGEPSLIISSKYGTALITETSHTSEPLGRIKSWLKTFSSNVEPDKKPEWFKSLITINRKISTHNDNIFLSQISNPN